MSNFTSFMDEAIKEAKKALLKNEVPVGAVIVDGVGNIIARSHNGNITRKDSTAHAEILAIREACEKTDSHRLDNCTLYVTLEPCSMCAGAISLARIRRVYFGASDLKFGAVEHGPKIFNSSSCHHRPEVYSGIKEEECQKLLKDFFVQKRN